MDDKEKDKKKGGLPIPTLKDSTKPKLQIKGLASTGLSFADRFKQFKKKDLAFILAGLGVLFMAPLAEHFMMSPESGSQEAFQPGFGFRGKGGFGDGGSPYEGGVNGLAPGGLLGGGADVITPLNVRDPSSLIMGPSSTPPAPVTSPAAQAPVEKKSSDWKDALANAGAQAAPAAAKRASLPVPKAALQGGLRGLGAIGGGGGGPSFSLAPISASNVPNTAAGSRSLTQVAAPTGFKGVAQRGPGIGGSGALDNLKKAAEGAASNFNRGGSAAGGLERAANTAMPGGSSGSGSEGGSSSGESGKSGGGNSDANKKSQGESLGFLMAKMRMEKDIERAYKLQEWEDMFWRKIGEKATGDLVSGIMTNFLMNPFGKKFDNWLNGPGKTPYYIICESDENGKKLDATYILYAAGTNYCVDGTGRLGTKQTSAGAASTQGQASATGCNAATGPGAKSGCKTLGDDPAGASTPTKDDKAKPPPPEVVKPGSNKDPKSPTAPPPSKGPDIDASKLTEACKVFKLVAEADLKGLAAVVKDTKEQETIQGKKESLKIEGAAYLKKTQNALAAAHALRKTSLGDCGATAVAGVDAIPGVGADKGLADALMLSEEKLRQDDTGGLTILYNVSNGAVEEMGKAIKDLEKRHDKGDPSMKKLLAEMEKQAKTIKEAGDGASVGKEAAIEAWETAYKAALELAGKTVPADVEKWAPKFDADKEPISQKLGQADKQFKEAQGILKAVGGYEGVGKPDAAKSGPLFDVGTLLTDANKAVASPHLESAPTLKAYRDSVDAAVKPDGIVGNPYGVASKKYVAQTGALFEAYNNPSGAPGAESYFTKTKTALGTAKTSIDGAKNDSYGQYGTNSKTTLTGLKNGESYKYEKSEEAKSAIEGYYGDDSKGALGATKTALKGVNTVNGDNNKTLKGAAVP